MSSVDQRVVEMVFDNSQFESGIRQSQKTLKNFDKSLQSESGKEGLTKMAEAVDSVKNKFSALGIAGITVIQNLTNSAVNFAKRLASEFTIEPIRQGLGEYELQMNSVQTIMANTDRNVKDVNASLDDLNEYADQTIYNFSEMTSNIGRFTAAGVGLEDAQSAIKGIANLAALSGSNSQQASSAMYQLSQAIASGRVNLMDWNSVVNAGMGGTKFQEALKRTGRAMGAVIDDSKSFRESISGSDTWLNGEILLETLKQISGAYTDAELAAQGYTDEQIADIQKMAKTAFDSATVVKTFTQLIDTTKEAIGSGWAQSFRIIIGDFEEAKELWTGVSNIISDLANKSAEARNSMLEVWKAQGGRDAIIEAISNAWQGLISILGAVKTAFENVFPPMTGERLAEISNKIKEGAAAFKEWATNSKTVAMITDIFTGLFSVIKIVVSAIQRVGQVIGTFIPPLIGPILEVLGSAAAAAGRFFTGLAEGFPDAEAFQQILENIKDKLSKVGDTFHDVTKKISDFFNGIGKNKKETESQGGFLEGIIAKFQAFAATVKKVLGPIVDAIKKFFKPITDQIKNAVSDFPPIDWGELLSTGSLAVITAMITKFVNNFSKIFGSIDDVIKGVGEQLSGKNSIVEKLKGVFDVLQAYQNNLNSQAIRNIAISIGILAASLFVLASIPTEQLISGAAALGALFAMMVGAVAVLQLLGKRMGKDAVKVGSNIAAMIGMAAAVAILALALKSIAEISGPDLLKGVVALAALAVITGMLAETTAKFKDQRGLISGSIAMAMFAMSMKELAKTVGELGALPFEDLLKGLGGVFALMAMLILFVNTTAKTIGAQGISAGLGIIAMAAALMIMANVVAKFGEMDLPTLGQGLLGVAGSMLILAGGMAILGKFGAAGISSAVGMIAAAGALMMVSSVVKEYGALPIEQVVQGIIALGASMAILVVGLSLMTGTIAGSVALLIAAAAIRVFTPAIIALGEAPIGTLIQGLIALAAGMAIMAVAGYLLIGAVPGLIGFGIAIGLIGAAVLMAGIGIAALAAGVLLLGAIGTAGAALFVEAMTVVVSGLAKLIPTVATAAAEAFGTFITTLAAQSGTIVAAVTDLVSKIIEGLATLIPQLVDFGLKAILGLVEGIRDNLGQIAGAAVEIITEFLNAMAETVPQMVEAGINLVVSLIEGIAQGVADGALRIAQAMRDLADALVEAFCIVLGIHSPSTVFEGFGGNILEGLINGIGNAVGGVVTAIADVGWQIISGIGEFISKIPEKGMELITNLADGISGAVGGAVNAAKGVIGNVISGIQGFVGNFLTAGGELIRNVGSGISKFASGVATAASNAVDGALSAARGFIDNFATIGNNIASGLAEGISQGVRWITDAAASVAQKGVDAANAAMGIRSPSRVFAKVGMFMDLGWAKGIKDYSEAVVKAIDYTSNKTVNRARRLSEQIQDAVDDALDKNPRITPVLDLSEMNQKAASISTLMGYGRSYKLAASVVGTAPPGSFKAGNNLVDSHNRTINQTNNITMPSNVTDAYSMINWLVDELNLRIGLEG